MKNKYNWAQVAEVYCKELGIQYPNMEEYLRGIYSDLSIEQLEEHEKIIYTILNETQQKNKSEYFPDLYIESSSKCRGTERIITKSSRQQNYKKHLS